jgi:energy-coupling factor transporter ATP-binding protein EcfA2
MNLLAFRILDFRSIIDTGWVPLSADGITVFVGQNESGKSSVLEALYYALSEEVPTADDFRIESDLPRVCLRIRIEQSEVTSKLHALSSIQKTALGAYLKQSGNQLEIECGWINDPELEDILPYHKAVGTQLQEMIETETLKASHATAANVHPVFEEQVSTDLPPEAELVSHGQSEMTEDSHIIEEIWNHLPLGVLFNEESGSLPSQVDIDDSRQPAGLGSRAALNYLRIADISLPKLLEGDKRARENALGRANTRVSADFNQFWSQTIGREGRLSLKCEIDHYSTSTPEKVGKPHLVFWICDGNNQLYPKQRSKGVRWFVSFYLQLKASEKARNRRVFLLDEPGANLHSKAQGDVLKLINELAKDTSSVVYSTHSPQMLEFAKLYRVHAVQRDGSLDDSPTVIIDAHRLGTASTDTLSPVLTAMGADLSQHQVIRKTNNVLLEEMSGYYYLSSFWLLVKEKKSAHFIAATGVNKLGTLANMFRGWGLDFIVAVDDDKQGREVYNSLKTNLFGDDSEAASKKLIKLRGLKAIEDIFDKPDFVRLVLKDESAHTSETNGEYLKQARRSKPVLAYQFKIAVEQKLITLESLSDESRKRIAEVVEMISSRLV